MQTRVFGILAILVAVVELAPCFTGPIAFVQKPSLLLFPMFTHGLDAHQTDQVTAYIERQIALANSYTIVSRIQLEDYLVRSGQLSSAEDLEPVNYREAHTISADLGLERFAMAICFLDTNRVELSISIRTVRDEEVIRKGKFTADTLEDLLRSVGVDGEDLRVGETLAVETKGVTLTDWLVLLILALQAGIGVIALLGRKPGALLEITWAATLVLFLFAAIYARNANMDYVQRFIAHQGQLQLARSTTTEQLNALLRFGPLLVLNGAYYVLRRLHRTAGPRLERIVTKWALPWSALSAVLYALSFPSTLRLEGLGFLAWFSLVPLFVVLATAPPLRAVFYGTFFGALQALIINYWHATYSYVTLHVIIIVFIVEFFLFMAALVPITRLSKRWGWIAVPAAWTVFEYLRSIGILGYPWGLIGASQYGLGPLIQIASITGVWGVGFVVLLANGAIAWTIMNVKRRLPLSVAAAVVAVSVVFGLFWIRDMDRRIASNSRQVTVVLLQPNTDPRKHAYRDNYERSVALTAEALQQVKGQTGSTPDLIVWPESGFPLDLGYWAQPNRRNSDWGRLVQEFRTYQASLGTWLLTGSQDHTIRALDSGDEERTNYNSSVLLGPRGQIQRYYHKMHLVPFTEYFPLDEEKFAWLHEIFQKFDISNWGLGDERTVFNAGGIRFVTPICFEDVFSDNVRRSVAQDVDIILNISNDYWSLSPVEGTQHGLLSLFRAVENQRPVLRSTASGYTVHIDAVGRIRPGSPKAYTPGYVVAGVDLPAERTTLYARFGDWFPRVCAVGLLAMVLGMSMVAIVRRRRPAR